MYIVRTMIRQAKFAHIFPLLALALMAHGWQCESGAQELRPIPANQVVWQHVGRIYLNPNTGKLLYVGYLAHLNGVSNSLFAGPPGESTAYFTFSTDVISLSPLPPNGSVSLSFASAGTFNVYYNARPNGDWSNPATFSSGQLIATFVREESLLPLLGPIGLHSLSEALDSAHSITFEGRPLDFKRLTPNGITFAQFLSSSPLTGIANYPVSFAAAGATTAVGAGEMVDR